MTTPASATHAEQDVALRDHVRKDDRVRSRLCGWLGTVRVVSRPSDDCYTVVIVRWDHGIETRCWVGDLELLPKEGLG